MDEMDEKLASDVLAADAMNVYLIHGRVKSFVRLMRTCEEYGFTCANRDDPVNKLQDWLIKELSELESRRSDSDGVFPVQLMQLLDGYGYRPAFGVTSTDMLNWLDEHLNDYKDLLRVLARAGVSREELGE